MKYDKFIIEKQEIIIDIEKRRDKCKDCGRLINFGINKNSKYCPVEKINNVWQFHNCFKGKTSLENGIMQDEENQEYLNNL